MDFMFAAAEAFDQILKWDLSKIKKVERVLGEDTPILERLPGLDAGGALRAAG